MGPKKCRGAGRGALISSSSQLSLLATISQKLGRANMETLKGSCFGHLFSIQEIQFQGQLFHMLLRNLVDSSSSQLKFNIQGREIEFGHTEFTIITGLKFKDWFQPPVESDMHREVFHGKHGGRVAFEFLAKATHRSKQSLDKSLSRSDGNNITLDANGLVIALQVWAYEVMPMIVRNCAILAPSEVMFPRILRWSASKVVKYEVVNKYFSSMGPETLEPVHASDYERSFLQNLCIPTTTDGPILVNQSDTEPTDPPEKRMRSTTLGPAVHVTNCQRSVYGSPTAPHHPQAVTYLDVLVLEKRLNELEQMFVELKKHRCPCQIESSSRNPLPVLISNSEAPMKENVQVSADQCPELVAPEPKSRAALGSRTHPTPSPLETAVPAAMCPQLKPSKSCESSSRAIRSVSRKFSLSVLSMPDSAKPKHSPVISKSSSATSSLPAAMSSYLTSTSKSPELSGRPIEYVSRGVVISGSRSDPFRTQRPTNAKLRRIPLSNPLSLSTGGRTESKHDPNESEYTPTQHTTYDLWYKKARRSVPRGLLHLPIETAQYVGANWFEKIWSQRGFLSAHHIDAVLNLLVIQSEKEPQLFTTGWAVMEDRCWDALSQESVDVALATVKPYVVGELPRRERGLPWHLASKVYGVRRMNGDPCLCYEVSLDNRRITVYDSLSKSRSSEMVQQVFGTVSRNISYVCGELKVCERKGLTTNREWEVVIFQHPPNS
ncbi:hypothetical protein C2S53_005620 [Perilla frutescens var. hirtella]|uniref:Uncharacterized protein n=1 Tax=Perilla frutescens var. hirtella TaxID=608512 RepID=A0AAD4PAI2_PERFH|nr:hypothetical protein C2S53_005620 [Perilla frutescens var. hirtella]